MRLTLKISGSKCVGVDTGPVIKIKPSITTAMPTASKIKIGLVESELLFTHLFIYYLTIYYLLSETLLFGKQCYM